MEQKTEEQDTHQQPESEETETTEEQDEQITLSKSELEELRKKADVSSQNFERAKKAESRLKELETLDDSLSGDEEVEVSSLKRELSEIRQSVEKRDVLDTYPQLKSVWSEFEQFRADDENSGMNLRTAAKAFVVEKGLSDTEKRKGLEKTTGGNKAPGKTGMSQEEIADLRLNHGKRYREMLKNGQIKA